MKSVTEKQMSGSQPRIVLPLPGFTPGPWHIEYPLPGDTSQCAKSGCQIAIQAPTGPDVCWIRSFNEWEESARANAHLISAAPDLLEVTMKMLRAFEYLAGEYEAAKDPVIVAAREAVAKASGQNDERIRAEIKS